MWETLPDFRDQYSVNQPPHIYLDPTGVPQDKTHRIRVPRESAVQIRAHRNLGQTQPLPLQSRGWRLEEGTLEEGEHSVGKGRVKVGEPRKASLIGTKTEEKEPGRTREKEKMRKENSQ